MTRRVISLNAKFLVVMGAWALVGSSLLFLLGKGSDWLYFGLSIFLSSLNLFVLKKLGTEMLRPAGPKAPLLFWGVAKISILGMVILMISIWGKVAFEALALGLAIWVIVPFAAGLWRK